MRKRLYTRTLPLLFGYFLLVSYVVLPVLLGILMGIDACSTRDMSLSCFSSVYAYLLGIPLPFFLVVTALVCTLLFGLIIEYSGWSTAKSYPDARVETWVKPIENVPFNSEPLPVILIKHRSTGLFGQLLTDLQCAGIAPVNVYINQELIAGFPLFGQLEIPVRTGTHEITVNVGFERTNPVVIDLSANQKAQYRVCHKKYGVSVVPLVILSVIFVLFMNQVLSLMISGFDDASPHWLVIGMDWITGEFYWYWLGFVMVISVYVGLFIRLQHRPGRFLSLEPVKAKETH